MYWVKSFLIIAGVVFLAFALAGVIQMLFLAGAAFTLAYAIHLRVLALWWVGLIFLICVVLSSIWGLVVDPRGEFIMLDVLGMLFSIGITYWWWKQKDYFSANARKEC